MTLNSMTGYGSATGALENATWSFEAKSVNAKGLDMRVSYAPGCEAFDQTIRNAIKAGFKRGAFQVNLSLRTTSNAGAVAVETALLTQLARTCRIRDRQMGAVSPSTDTASLLGLKGVLSTDKANDRIDTDSPIGQAINQSIQIALEQLAEARKREGAALKEVLERILSEMEATCQEAQSIAAAQPQALKERLQGRLAEILEGRDLNAERLEQEVAVLVSKADVTEELDRLAAHISEARHLLSGKGPVGRKLDFLSQEFLREANTLGSKSASLDMTRQSLALKALIDQFKEQVANVE